MRARADAVDETRRRIVHTAINLFAERTAAATSMEDIARAARVSTPTVYRHFGDFDALAQACAETAFAISEVPTPEVAAAQFAGLPTIEEKLRQFIEISCHCYDRAAQWLSAERRERHLPAFARTLAREEQALDAIERGLLAGSTTNASTIGVVKALVDFPFWQSLMSAGVSSRQIPAVVHALVLDRLAADRAPSRLKKGPSDARNRSDRTRASASKR
jgi:AcrR family transcriptional regulator